MRIQPVVVRALLTACVAVGTSGGASGAEPMTVFRVTQPGDSGAGSLRQAILDANASPGGDRIEFGMHLCDPVCVIRPTIALPALTGGNTVIDGYSQAGALPPSASAPARIRIALDGSGVASQNGLNIASARNTVQGLAIYGFGWNGIAIGGPDAGYNRILGNHIGLDEDGLGLASRRPNGFDGVFLGLGAHHNTIGGDILTERNVISGNTWDGVGVHGSDTIGNQVQGNFIGLDASGRAALSNTLDGLRFYGGAGQLVVGVVDAPGQRNVISGNGRDGVRMAGAGTTGLYLDGNLIGTRFDGFAALPNGGDGLHVLDEARNVSLGTSSSSALGLIAGNAGHGIHFEGGSGGAVVRRHFIGSDASGRLALPNGDGIRVVDFPGLTIGGHEPGQGNLISGNRGAGIVLTGDGTTDCVIEGNRIGVDVSGGAALGNAEGGIRILAGASDNHVGGGTVLGTAGNLISGNRRSGVEIAGLGSDGNALRGNRIGCDAACRAALGNDEAGIHVHDGAAANRIGGLGEGEGNLIAANGVGIALQAAGPGSLIYANRIGLGAEGASRSLGNRTAGVRIEDGSRDAQIQANAVADNGAEGLLIQGEDTWGNRLRGNRVYDNVGPGIRVTGGAQRAIQPPRLDTYDPSRLRVGGRGCPGCEVELFSDAADEGAQPIGLGSVAGSGDFGLTLSEAPSLANLTALVSDPDAGSSAFSVPLPALASTATPTETASATASSTSTASASPGASPSVTPKSTATPTLTPTSTPTETPTSTPTPGATPLPTPGASQTASPGPTPSVIPSSTPGRTPTRAATSSPAPSRTGGATASPTGSSSPAPGGGRLWLPSLERSPAGASAPARRQGDEPCARTDSRRVNAPFAVDLGPGRPARGV
ncbi:MAG: right-handed parallel beta-helix repeat-containing protein [Caldilineae bacterium]|nr:right-handed parallel beta-helix repeat-containing protein [Chloroflexota bacterium]MCB9177058.1 right-handed parallel beta-helix repeat-containing protein [Caldilineae bacterium]